MNAIEKHCRDSKPVFEINSFCDLLCFLNIFHVRRIHKNGPVCSIICLKSKLSHSEVDQIKDDIWLYALRAMVHEYTEQK